MIRLTIEMPDGQQAMVMVESFAHAIDIETNEGPRFLEAEVDGYCAATATELRDRIAADVLSRI